MRSSRSCGNSSISSSSRMVEKREGRREGGREGGREGRVGDIPCKDRS